MSKSLGNLTLVSNLLKDYSADAIRVALLNHQYRYPWECFPADLALAANIVGLFQQVREIVGTDTTGEDSLLRGRFTAAMDNDLNTPEALLLLQHAAEHVLATQDLNTGNELLRQANILGLTV